MIVAVTPTLKVGTQQFDGNLANAMIIPHLESHEVANGTVIFNVVPDDINGTRQGIISKDSSSYDNGGHFNVMMLGDDLQLRMQSTNSDLLLDAANIFSVGKQTQIAITFGEAGVFVYADGNLVASDPSWQLGLLGNQEPWVIGANQWASGDLVADNLKHPFAGSVDLMFYGKQLNMTKADDVDTLTDESVDTSLIEEPDVTTSEDPDVTASESDDVSETVDEPSSTSVSVGLSCSPPESREDGSSLPITEIDFYQVRYTNQSSNETQHAKISDPSQCSVTLESLDAGVWEFQVATCDASGLCGSYSAPVELDLTNI